MDVIEVAHLSKSFGDLRVLSDISFSVRRGEVLAVLEGLKRDGITLLVVTHEIGFARRAADRVVVLDGGTIIEEGSAAQVLDAPRTSRTRQFLVRNLARIVPPRSTMNSAGRATGRSNPGSAPGWSTP